MTRRSWVGRWLAAVSALAACRSRNEDGLGAVASLVKRRLGYLQIAREDLERFAQDFSRQAPQAERRLASAGGWFLWPRPAPGLVELEHRVLETFLLSTDFFRNGADEKKPVRYLFLYDPHSTACANPFAKWSGD